MSTPFPPMRRVITSHNEKGRAFVAHDDQISTEILPHGPRSVLVWSSDSYPADISGDRRNLADTAFVNKGSVFRVVEVPPRSVGALHRSHSLDYIIVQKGSVTLTLEDGVRTKQRRGVCNPAGDDARMG